MKTSSVWRMSLLTLAMFIVVDFLTGVGLSTKPAGTHSAYGWAVASNAIVAFTVGYLGSWAPWRGFKLAAALASVPLVIQVINVIEGLNYLNTDQAIRWGMALSPLKYLLIVPLWLVFFHSQASSASSELSLPARTFWGKLWRIALCSFLYLILYFIAGMLIFPFVRGFYATQPMPSVGRVVALQLLLRGPVFVGICVMLARMISPRRMSTAVAVGLVFTLISGVAPLIIPNPIFPNWVRWIHLGEVTASNFLFGVVIALIWSRKVVSHPNPRIRRWPLARTAHVNSR